MELGLKGKVVVITGGASGIGSSIVRQCALEGAIPIIVDRDGGNVEVLQGELTRNDHQSEALVVDLVDAETAADKLQQLGEKLGHIDALVNNAGTNDGVGLENGTPELFVASLQKNLIHYYAMFETALPYLKETKGAVVNIASKVAITGQGGTSGYAAAKGAILELTSEWASEFAKDGIRVNAIVPAEVWTPQYEDWVRKTDHPGGKQSIESRIPLGKRFTEPNEIAAAVLFLLRPGIGITGQHIYIDGGYVHLDRSLA